MLTTVIKRIVRRPLLSLAGLVLASVLCILLCYLAGYRNGLEERLREVRDSYEILCVVTDSRGVQADKLSLNHRFAEFVMDREKGLGNYVKTIRLTMDFPVSSPLGSGTLTGVTDAKALSSLNPAVGGGCDYTVADFFGSRDNICLVPEEYYEMAAGKTLAVTVTLKGIGGVTEKAESEYRVVGRYKGSGADLVIPYGAAARLTSSAGSARADSLSFVLADNTKADEMMEKAREMFTEVDPASDSGRPALTVQDRQYKATLAELEQNIARTDALLPISAFLSLAAGFMIGFVSVRGETRTYALMRTLGVSGPKLVLLALGEQLLLPAAGILTVGLLPRQPAAALTYLACHTIGCTLAVLRPALASPTQLLRAQE